MEIPFAPGGLRSGPSTEEERKPVINQPKFRTISEEEGSMPSSSSCNGGGETLIVPSSRLRTCCSSQNLKKQFKKRLPILTWLPKYQWRDYVLSDLIAGISVGLTVIPQSIAYAAIAGLTPEFGLYSSYLGCFLYIIFGSCRQLTIGPTAVLALITFETCGSRFPSCAVLTTFYSGVAELFMAVLHLGWVVSFISEPVVNGFTSGAAVTIISSQIKNFFGFRGPKGNGFVGYWSAILSNFNTLRIGDTVMGLCCFVALILMKEVKDLKMLQGRSKSLKQVIWLISISRNVIIVLLSTLTAYLWEFYSSGPPPFALTGNVRAGFPTIAPPDFRLPYNSTTVDDPSSYLSIGDSLSFLGAGPLAIALIAVLQNVAICKAFGAGQGVDANQEMLVLGLGNVVTSFFSGIPICGSFSRSAVNNASGVKSPFSGLFTGLLILLSLGFLTPTFYYIPKSSLAAVIISAVMVMIELQPLGVMWRINKLDLVSCLITFLSSILLGMEYGIMIGVGSSLILLLFKGSKRPDLNPQLRIDPATGINFIYARPDHGLTFPSVDHVRESLAELVGTWPETSVIVISFQKWTLPPDYTVVTAVASLVKGLVDSKELVFVDVSPVWRQAFESAGFTLTNKDDDKFPHCCSNYSDLCEHLLAVARRRTRASSHDGSSGDHSAVPIENNVEVTSTISGGQGKNDQGPKDRVEGEVTK